MKPRGLGFLIMIWVVLLGSLPAWPSRTIEVVGTGITRDSAIEDAKRTAVEQVVGVYLTSRSQVKNFVLDDDTIISETVGLIKSYQVISCNTSKGLYNCRLAAEVEGDENKIAILLRRLLGKKTFSVQVKEYIEGQPLKDHSLSQSLEARLIGQGYYTVKDSFKPFYRIRGTAEVRKARSQLALKVVVLTNLRIALMDRAEMELAVYTTRDTDRCIGSGNTLDEAGMDLFRCLAPDVGRQFIQRINDKI
jgi:hypothetical protein